jgi:hypothetical protein
MVSSTTWEVPMSTSVHDERFEPPLAEDRTIGLAESRREVADAAIGFLTLVGFILVLVGVWSSLVLGVFYLRSHVTDLPFLGQLFGS